ASAASRLTWDGEAELRRQDATKQSFGNERLYVLGGLRKWRQPSLSTGAIVVIIRPSSISGEYVALRCATHTRCRVVDRLSVSLGTTCKRQGCRSRQARWPTETPPQLRPLIAA